jgi:hypothetical protein
MTLPIRLEHIDEGIPDLARAAEAGEQHQSGAFPGDFSMKELRPRGAGDRRGGRVDLRLGRMARKKQPQSNKNHAKNGSSPNLLVPYPESLFLEKRAVS